MQVRDSQSLERMANWKTTLGGLVLTAVGQDLFLDERRFYKQSGQALRPAKWPLRTGPTSAATKLLRSLCDHQDESETQPTLVSVENRQAVAPRRFDAGAQKVLIQPAPVTSLTKRLPHQQDWEPRRE
jgi:hypothetical protein